MTTSLKSGFYLDIYTHANWELGLREQYAPISAMAQVLFPRYIHTYIAMQSEP